MMTTTRMPAPSARPRKILSPSRTFAPLEGLVEMGVGSGKGEASTSPDPASAGLGVVTSSLSVIGPGSHPHRNRAGALANYAIASTDLSRRSLKESGSGTYPAVDRLAWPWLAE